MIKNEKLVKSDVTGFVNKKDKIKKFKHMNKVFLLV